ncbi:MAG: hypothetical protein V7609_3463 [Verrucomicrobiota bacterium]
MRDPRLGRFRGFTLTEMLVSIAVLALLALLISQIMNSATAAMTRGRKGIDADAEARIIFDRMATDFTRMVRRNDIDFYGKDTTAGTNRPMNGNDQIAFYSDVRGYYTDSNPSPTATPTRNQRNPISLIGYTVSSDPSGRPQLVRLAKGLTWESNNGWQGISHLPIQIIFRWPNVFQFNTTSSATYNGMTDADFEVISDSVVRFEYCYLLQPTSTAAATVSFVPYSTAITGHSTADFCTDVAAIVVSLAILDPSSRVIVTDYSELISQTLFQDATAMDTAAFWTTAINQPAFATTARIPKTAASAVRVYQRRFSLIGNTD